MRFLFLHLQVFPHEQLKASEDPLFLFLCFYLDSKKNFVRAKRKHTKISWTVQQANSKRSKKNSASTLDFKQNLARECAATFKTLKKYRNLIETNLLTKPRIFTKMLLRRKGHKENIIYLKLSNFILGEKDYRCFCFLTQSTR